MPTLDLQASQLYYERHGEGPAIVFAHGIGGNHAAWFQQIAVFARSYEVIVFDHRGFGRSTDTEQLGRNAFVSDLGALVDHLGLNRFALVGANPWEAALAWVTPQKIRNVLRRWCLPIPCKA
jgi:3-oxoadipate enol-lactonase